eukprot:6198994-Pleurochrysis_carterae.AAC.5
MVRPTLRVTLCQARRSVTMRSVPTAAKTTLDDVISIHDRGDCACERRLRQTLLASVEPGERGWIVSTTKMSKLRAQQCEEDKAEALDIIRGAGKPGP